MNRSPICTLRSGAAEVIVPKSELVTVVAGLRRMRLLKALNRSAWNCSLVVPFSRNCFRRDISHCYRPGP